MFIVSGTLVFLILQMFLNPRFQFWHSRYPTRRNTARHILDHLFSLSCFGLVVINPHNGRWLSANPQLASLLGYSQDEIARLHVSDIYPMEQAAHHLEQLAQFSHASTSHLQYETQLKHNDGHLVSVRFTLLHLNEPRPTRKLLIGLIEDISELRHRDQLLQQTASIFNNIQDGVLITDTHHKIIRINQALCQVLGYEEQDLVGQSPMLFHSDVHPDQFYRRLHQELRTLGFWQGEMWNRSKNGTNIPFICNINAIRDTHGEVLYSVSVYTNISKLKKSEAQLEFLAYHDPLTRLPNRSHLLIRIAQAMEQAKQTNSHLALITMDLDRFKDINDCFGHSMGDSLLQLVSQRLQMQLSAQEFICRQGSDEFTILLTGDLSLNVINHQASQLLELMRLPFHLPNQQEVTLSASIGICLYPEHANTPEELFQRADAAMYRAKASGMNSFKYYSQELSVTARARLDTEIALRKALDNHQLQIYFQPQVSLKTQQIIGAEALVRFNDPQRGIISPGEFIDIAEETGLIRNIDEWMLQQACRYGAEWLKKGYPALTIAVNVSPAEFLYGNMLESIISILQQTGFPAANLELELTERTLMSHEKACVEILNLLRQQGIRFAIDDFGTGYSSLAYLKRFPLDILKIDKSFVDDIPNQTEGMQITASIVDIAHALHLDVVAEGVENEAQMNFLQKQGCDSYQGYLTSKPVPAAEFERRFLKKEPPDTEPDTTPVFAA